MNGIATLPDWAALTVALLLFVGATIIVIGALGLLRRGEVLHMLVVDVAQAIGNQT